MNSIKILITLLLFSSSLPITLQAQPAENTDPALNSKQQSIVTISAYAAKGDQVQLQKALHSGLDAGLTI